MEKYTYSIVLFFTIIICFVYSFDKRIKFNQHFISFLKGSTLVAIPFIAWDIWFTNSGIWWFNYDYTLGLKIINLPIEEWLFFICIPFSCVFTYFCLTKFFNFNWANSFNTIIAFITIIVCLTIALLNVEKTYTMVTGFVTAITMSYLHLIRKVKWIGQASVIFFILMLGFFPVNGVLTGFGLESPIVNYNSEKILNIRMITIPIEDAVYGYSQFMWNIFFFNYFRNKKA